MDTQQIASIAETAAMGVGMVAGANPEVALAVKLVPVAIQLLQSAQQITEAGAMTPDQLAALFAQIGQGVMSAHNAWAAMNQAQEAKA